MRYFQLSRQALVGVCLLALSLISTGAGAVALSPVTIANVEAATDGSDQLVVQGYVDAAEGVASLDINGVPVTNFDGEIFDVQISPASEYLINVNRMDGTSTQVTYADPTQKVDSAVQVVVGNQLMADVGPALGTLLTDLDLNALLGVDPNECVLDTWHLIGCDVYIDELAIQGTPDVDMSFTPGSGQALTINIGIKIPSAVVDTRVKRSYWFGYDRTRVTTHDIEFFVQLGVRATANQSIKLILDDASDINIQLGRMDVDSTVMAAYLLPLFKDSLTGLVNNHLANIAGPFLALLPIPSIPLSLPLDIDGDGVNDAEFDINMSAQLLDVLASGDGQAVLAGAISSATVAPGREVLGSRVIDGVLPTADPVLGTTDLTAAVSVNLVNQVLTAVYQSGIDEKLALTLPLGDLGTFGTQVPYNGYAFDEFSPTRIELSFGAPPELQVNNSSQYPLGLQVVLPQMRVKMIIETYDTDLPWFPNKGDFLILDLTADYVVSTSLAADQSGQLQLQFANLLAIKNVGMMGGALVDLIPPFVDRKKIIADMLPTALKDFEPMLNDLLNVARLELDIGQVLSDFLNADFPSVIVEGYVTETGVSDDEAYMEVGLGLDFH